MAWIRFIYPLEFSCLKVDVKPTDGIPEGSVCYEIDVSTVKTYRFLQGAWVELS